MEFREQIWKFEFQVMNSASEFHAMIKVQSKILSKNFKIWEEILRKIDSFNCKLDIPHRT